MSQAAESEGGRRRGRAARREARERGPATPTAPYVARNIGVFRLLDEEGLALIERKADQILQEIGIEFRGDQEVLAILKRAGADVRGERVRFEPGHCRTVIQASAPSRFTQHARNPARSVEIGGENSLFCPSFGPPFVHDMERGRRYATLEDFHNLTKLHHMLPGVHHSGGVVVEPVDVPVPERHLDMAYGHLRFNDKPFMGAVTAPERSEDTVRMAKIVFGEDFVEANCCLYSVVNSNAPLVWDATMLGALKTYARHNQAVVVSPFILAGAMSPVSIAGTLAQVLAEAQAGLCLIQLIRPGAPAVFGTFASPISMQTGAPTFGTPEGMQMQFCASALVRRLGVPFHSVGALTAAKVPDAQAAYEGARQLQAAFLAGVNFIIHATGCLEGLLTTGYEKLIMDADMCEALSVFAQNVDLSEIDEAIEAIRDVGPGAHFLGCDHTQAHFETAFWRSEFSDNKTFEQWSAEGSAWAQERAHQRWKALLADYQAPALDPAVDEALKDFVARRRAEIQAD
ncbi:MAG: trimethylamine methyltransferase family protein [Pseudomonadota bacterium]